MAFLRLDDTIAAIATPPGEGAIGMVRLSGPEALRIAQRLFRPSGRAASQPRAGWQSHRLYHGHVVDPGSDRVADEVLLAYMRPPRTYTRQAMVEITGHGSSVSVREILRLAVSAGARPAERGELTLRAFLLGRLDLAQAEAVLDAVRARTPGALSLAVDQLGGGLSRMVGDVRREIMNVYAHLEATIDFAEDDIPTPSTEEVALPLRRAGTTLDSLLCTVRSGRLQREGMRVAIVGRPNAGKSSLLNALLQTERAIVTPVAGTTRDVIEETIDIDGIPAVLSDTAGITDTTDPVERLGVARSQDALVRADVVVLVLDTSVPLTEEDRSVAALVRRRAEPGGAMVVLSKADLPAQVDHTAAGTLLPQALVVRVSSITGEGLATLRDTLHRLALSGSLPDAVREVIVGSARHQDALARARSSLNDAVQAVEQGLASDFVCTDLRACLAALGEVTGESVTDDLLERIFSQFCIGK